MKKMLTRLRPILIALFLMSLGGISKATEYCVNPDGSNGCYDRIQSAIDASAQYDTILVYPGTYFESDTLKKTGLVLMGVGEPCSIKILSSTGPGVMITHPETILRGILVEAAAGSGVYCHAIGNMYINNCVIQYCAHNGIYHDKGTLYASNNVIVNNGHRGIRCIDRACYLFSNIIVGSDMAGVFANWQGGSTAHVYCECNDVWDNDPNYRVDSYCSIDHDSDINVDPVFEPGTCYRLQADSPCIDMGRPGNSYLDCDGTRSDIGIWGGPYAYCGPGPVVISLQVIPSTVVHGDAFEIKATGATR